ncbi:E3 ubiquitin-protein ligase TRAIP-like isoform X2 [Rhodnius prolixus]|uniref:E3 ubiquitin-protein ligase TRAIP-like isoform X2 n=1 Tax=Rhodnius prolixus TaxID=13249 RepID=UPI003D18EBE8
MHIQCNICTDLISQTSISDITGLTCGHIFHGECLRTWLQRSATCPQCRARVTSTKQHKIYLTLASEPEGQDIITLTRTVDNFKHDLKMKTLECKKLTEELNESKVREAVLLEESKGHKMKVIEVGQMKLQLQEQKKFAISKSKELTEAKLKIVNLESELKQYQTLKSAVSNAKKEVDVGIDLESLDASQLIFVLGTFKKDIARLSKMDEDLKKALSKSESTNFSLSKEMIVMQESLELKDRIIESLKGTLDTLKKDLHESTARNSSAPETKVSPSKSQLPAPCPCRFKKEQNKSLKKCEPPDESHSENELPAVRKVRNILPASKPVFRITSDRLKDNLFI